MRVTEFETQLMTPFEKVSVTNLDPDPDTGEEQGLIMVFVLPQLIVMASEICDWCPLQDREGVVPHMCSGVGIMDTDLGKVDMAMFPLKGDLWKWLSFFNEYALCLHMY